MYKIMVIGDLEKIHNVFGVYNSETKNVDICSWLDIFQDIKFEKIKYLNLGLNSEKKVVFLDKFNRIPKTRDEFKSKKSVFVLCKQESSDKVRFISFPENKIVTSTIKELVDYCDSNNVVRLNFDFKRYPKVGLMSLHKDGIPKIK